LTGVGPKLPESGWRILYEDALTAFLKDERNLELAGLIGDWIVACRRDGPPSHGIDAGDDLHLSPVMGTRVVAEYLVVEYEFMIVVREFR
jgi:hypothetical protein